MKSNLLKGSLTVVGAVLLTTLGIFAADTMRGVDHNLPGLSGKAFDGTCGEGMVPLGGGTSVLCVDVYEASPSPQCPHQDPANILETEKNANTKDCYAASVPAASPWSYVSLPQAQRLCAGAGKRLPNGDEWYRIALGTEPDKCVVDSGGRQNTGSACISTIGAHDAIGNVWEWVDETVVGNMYDSRPLPEDGYVTSVDAAGVAITSAERPDILYGSDYIWSEKEGVFGMIRGGFYGSRSDAGLYTLNASISTSFVSQGVGFRCVKDVL